ncbi:MAG: hypothetical protein IPM56_07520 [Ignavibacteriales bacterium]|nr:MAG: hypothetical protein IPM56_07520 [Ignavibacteriales bacterium]
MSKAEPVQSYSYIDWRLIGRQKYFVSLFLFLQVCLIFQNPGPVSGWQFNWFNYNIDVNNSTYCDFSSVPNLTLIVNEKLKLKFIEFFSYIVIEVSELNNITLKVIFFSDVGADLLAYKKENNLSRSPPFSFSW